MSEYLLPANQHSSESFQPQPERHQFLAGYPNGKLKLELITAARRSQQEPEVTTLQAYDTLGQSAFGMFSESVVSGRNGTWEHQVLITDRHLPTVIRRTQIGPEPFAGLSKAIGQALRNLENRAAEVDAESEQESEPPLNRQQLVVFEYDQESRISKQTIVELIDLNEVEVFPADAQAEIFLLHLTLREYGLELEEHLLPLGTESHEFSYDDHGRLRSVVDYAFTYNEEGEVEKNLDRADLYEYHPVNSGELQILKANGRNIKYKDLHKGLVLDSLLVIKNIHLTTGNVTAYACYENVDTREDEILFNYHNAKRNPVTLRMQRKTPTEMQGWINWQSLPEQVVISTYVTAEGLEKFNEGVSLAEVGTPADLENPVRVMYWDEFAQYVAEKVNSDEEAAVILEKFFKGEISVRVPTSINSEVLLPIITKSRQFENYQQRLVYFAPYLYSYANMVSEGYSASLEVVIKILDDLFDLYTGFDKEIKYKLADILSFTFPPSAVKNFYIDFLNNSETALKALVKQSPRYGDLFQ